MDSALWRGTTLFRLVGVKVRGPILLSAGNQPQFYAHMWADNVHYPTSAEIEPMNDSNNRLAVQRFALIADYLVPKNVQFGP